MKTTTLKQKIALGIASSGDILEKIEEIERQMPYISIDEQFDYDYFCAIYQKYIELDIEDNQKEYNELSLFNLDERVMQ